MEDTLYSKHFHLEKVKEGIYAAIAKAGGGSVGNAGIIDLGNQTIIFDTFNTQQAAEDLKRMAETITNRPVKWVVNSHWHGDHIRGNQVFKGSTIVSSLMTQEKMKEFHPVRMQKQKDDLTGLSNYIQSLQERLDASYDAEIEEQLSFLREIRVSLPSLELVLPQLTFQEELTFHGSKRSAVLFTLGGGHSYCDGMLYIPEEKVIFMGDLLFVQTHPSLFEESDPEKWIQILKKADSLDIDIAVPGHGSIGNKENISAVIEYINGLGEEAGSGKSMGEIHCPEKYRNWASPEIYQKNIKRMIELSAGVIS